MVPSFCFSIADLPSHGQLQGIRLTLSLNTEGVQSFYSWKYFHTLSKCANKTKCLMPLFSCVAKCAFHNLLTQPVLKKDYLESTNWNFHVYLLVCHLGSKVLKLVPCYLFLYFLEKKSHEIWLVAVLFSYVPIFLSLSSGFWATDAI